MRIAIYYRVSTSSQDTASQELDLKDWAAKQAEKGHSVRWYGPEKASGKTMSRPHLDKLLADMRAGKLDQVAVWRLDRLGRLLSGLCQFIDEATSLGVSFVSLREGFDLSTVAGRFAFNVLASAAQFETELRGERVRAGIEAKRARGEKWGNGRPKGSANKATPEVVEQVKRMRDEGKPVAQIARVCKLSRQTCYVILRG